MSKCRGSISATAAFGVVLVLSTSLLNSSQTRLVSAKLLALAREGTIEQFVREVANEQVPIGVVLLAGDVHTPIRTIPDASEDRVELDVALLRFELNHPLYRVARKPFGGLTILPRASGWCAPVLQAKVPSFAATGPVFEVNYQLYRAWSRDQSQYVPPGLVGEGADPTRYRTVVAVDLLAPMLEEVLDAIVQQVAGLGWAIKEVRRPAPEVDATERDGCNLALFDGQSWADTSYTLFPP